jgi:uncharacterized membrane protein
MKEAAEIVTKYLSSAVELAAALIIAGALVEALFSFAKRIIKNDDSLSNERIRIKFGSYVAVALELLLGADVLATAVAPTWNDIGKLAAIAVLRTALNFFLERELKNSGLGRNKTMYTTDTSRPTP